MKAVRLGPLLVGIALMLLSGCENRKKRCEALYRRVAACAPADRRPSPHNRREFVARCQQEYDGSHVRRTRDCVAKHRDCAALRACLVKRLKLDPGPDGGAVRY
jgi:hypothetical protein